MHRYHHYQKRQVRPQYNWHLWKSTKGSVITLLLIMAAIIYIGRLNAVLASTQGMSNLASSLLLQKDQRTEQLIRENDELRAKLDASQKIVTPDTTKQIVRVYLVRIFGSDAQMAERIFTCESNLNPAVENHNNKNGTIDSGVAQINEVHAKQFEQMMGVPFMPYSHDIAMNLKFAKWIFDQSGWNPWACKAIIGI